MNKLLKILYIMSWIPIAFIKLIIVIMGLVLTPFFLINRTQEHFNLDGRYFAKLWKPWDNLEEGCPKWWRDKCALQSWKDADGIANKFVAFMRKTFPRWWWFAIRNPANGTRFIFKDRITFKMESDVPNGEIEPHQLIGKGLTSGYKWRYDGPFAGYKEVSINADGTYNEKWFGWKIGSEVPGLGFTVQYRKNGDIGE